jgi:hypothetical protein
MNWSMLGIVAVSYKMLGNKLKAWCLVTLLNILRREWWWVVKISNISVGVNIKKLQ